jgi:hypothetical protein
MITHVLLQLLRTAQPMPCLGDLSGVQAPNFIDAVNKTGMTHPFSTSGTRNAGDPLDRRIDHQLPVVHRRD